MNTAAGIVERVRPEPAFYQHSRDHDSNEGEDSGAALLRGEPAGHRGADQRII